MVPYIATHCCPRWLHLHAMGSTVPVSLALALPQRCSAYLFAPAGSTFTPLEHVFHGQRPKQVRNWLAPPPCHHVLNRLQLTVSTSCPLCCHALCSSRSPIPSHCLSLPLQFTVSNSSLSEYGVLGFELGEAVVLLCKCAGWF